MPSEAYGYGPVMAEATKEVVATYRDAEAARTAIQALERHGVDADRIRMIATPGVRTPKTDDAMREPDMAVTRKVGTRALGTSAGLAVVAGVAVFVLARFVLDSAMGAALAFGVGAFMAGGALGFFLGGVSVLAVSDEWGETFEATGPATIAVHVPEDAVIDLRDRIEATHPDRVTIA
jgi:predicted phage tail protein